MSDDAMTKGLLDDLRARGYSTATGRATVAIDGDIPRATFEAWSASMRHDLALALGMEFHGSVPTWPMIAHRAQAMRRWDQERYQAEIQARDKAVLDHLNGIIFARFIDNKTPTWQEIETRLRELVRHEVELSRIADLVGFLGKPEFPAAGAVVAAVQAFVHHPRRMSGSRTIDAAMRGLRRESDGTELDAVPGVEKPKLTLLFDDQTEVP